MAEFHALTGAHVGTGKPCADVVKLLEDALALAQRGEIIGCVLGVVTGNNGTQNIYAPGCADAGLMMLTTHSLHTRMTRLWYDGGENISELDKI